MDTWIYLKLKIIRQALVISIILILFSCSKDSEDYTCSNGVLDVNEEQVDCGGVCPSCDSTASFHEKPFIGVWNNNLHIYPTDTIVSNGDVVFDGEISFSSECRVEYTSNHLYNIAGLGYYKLNGTPNFCSYSSWNSTYYYIDSTKQLGNYNIMDINDSLMILSYNNKLSDKNYLFRSPLTISSSSIVQWEVIFDTPFPYSGVLDIYLNESGTIVDTISVNSGQFHITGNHTMNLSHGLPTLKIQMSQVQASPQNIELEVVANMFVNGIRVASTGRETYCISNFANNCPNVNLSFINAINNKAQLTYNH